jgi:predicted nucleic acid-binding protein
MKLIITDVSVLFDLYQLGILTEFFALKAEISTTSFVYNEIVVANQVNEFEVYKRSQKLNVIALTEKEQEAVSQFKTKRNLKSMPDKTMLWKSIQLRCALLTCDKKLKLEAKDHGIEVHGSIWVIEKLVEEKILETTKAITFLNTLMTINDRLPQDEIDKLIKKLKTKILIT